MTKISIEERYFEEQEKTNRLTLAFWIYILSDCLLFAALFASYAVLHGNVLEVQQPQLFSLSTALLETLILLLSSFVCGLAILFAHKNKKVYALIGLTVTFLLGFLFLSLEMQEFAGLIKEGNSWRENAALSSFFTLVGMHGLHISIGLVWILSMGIDIAWRGITPKSLRRLFCMGLFWHFLDIIWIFIFTFVYCMSFI
jgi:cytochrome o ubiquinol oxidase subunit III